MKNLKTAAATAACRVPEGAIADQYQIRLLTDTAKAFKAMNSKERGAIVEAGFKARSFPWAHYSDLCARMGQLEQ